MKNWSRVFDTANGKLTVVIGLATFERAPIIEGNVGPEPRNWVYAHAAPEADWRVHRPFPQPWEWTVEVGAGDSGFHAEFADAKDAVLAIHRLVKWYGSLEHPWVSQQEEVLDSWQARAGVEAARK